MRLVSFSVQKYRSISSAQRLSLGELTTLIGPNNEGKSNILRALVVGMRLLALHSRLPSSTRAAVSGSRVRYSDSRDYEWTRDFPRHLQAKQPNGNTILEFEFELDEPELAVFKEEIKSQLNGSLPIRLSIGATGIIDVSVRKPGPGAASLTRKGPQIAQFVGRRLEIQYIPAHRTAEDARQVVSRMAADELRILEDRAAYSAAIEEIGRVQEPILRQVADSLVSVLGDFLPDLRNVEVRIPPEERYIALRRGIEIIIDDGTPTDLSLKGDGIQSLAALALLRRVSTEGESREFLLAIEEPEAHLHPHAIHQLRELLSEIASKQQVVITTHSPLLTNRLNTAANIIVNNKRAQPASSIAQVREVLGVRTADNLQSARLVLIVEGEEDCTALRAIVGSASSTIHAALAQGELAIESLGGGTNLGYKLSQLQDAMCLFHVFLDDDETGRRAIERAEEGGLLRNPADRSLTICEGMQNAEFEDLLDTALYEALLRERYNVLLNTPAFRNSGSKWSDRLKAVFRNSGQPWNSRTEAQVKHLVADAVARQPEGALNEHRRGPVDALVRSLEAKLAQLN